MSYVRFGLVLSMFLVLSACSSDGGSSDSGSTTVDVVITDPDKAAAFLDIFSDPVTQATEDERWEYALVTSAVLADNLSFRLVSGPSGMTISSDGLVQWTPTDEHGDTVNVTIEATYTDENGTVSRSQTFVMPVKHINDAPVIVSEASTSVLAGEIYNYAVQVEDPDDANNGTDLTYVVTTPFVSSLEGLSISNTGVIQWQAPSDPSYILQTVGYYFKVKVSDGGENGAISATQTWYLKVVPSNTAPVITSSPVTAATEDQAYSYQLIVEDAEDQNNGADLTFALSDGPAGMTVSSTGLIQWTPTENGTTVRTQSVQVSVADGGEQDVAPAVQAFDITVTPVNDAPTFIGSPSTSATEGSTYSYALQVTDPDDANNGTDLTFSLTSAPAGMTISSTGVISWTAPANVTSASVEAMVADGGENGAAAASLSWTISVDAVNDAPTITSVAPTMATEDSPYTYQIAVTDPDDANNGTDLTFTLVTAPEGMTVSATGAIAWTPVGDEGTVDVTIEVADGGENGVQPARQNFTITVAAVNDAPVITSAAVATATEDETYSYEVIATDEENDVLQWSLTTAPEGMIIDSATGVITWTPAEAVTSESVVVEVSDGEFTDTQSFTVAVAAVNDAPVITEGEATAIVTDEDTATTITLNATDIDTDSASLIWTIDTDALNGAASVSGTGASQTVTYTPTANFSGSDSFVVAVSDGELVATITVNVTVNEAGDAPVITEGETVSLTTNEDNLVLTVLSATDLDTDAANLSWSANDATNGQASVSGSGLTQTVTYTPNANFSGSDSFIVTVSDGVLSDMITVSVTVNSVNDAPVITSVPNTSATEAVAYSYAAIASDVEGDTLTWSLTEAPAGMEIDADTGVISWTPANGVETANVTLVAADADASATQTFTITVVAVNDAPEITSSPVTAATEGEIYSYTATATDAENDTLTWSLTQFPDRMTIDANSGEIIWTPANGVTDANVTVEVTDGVATATQDFVVIVGAVNDAPVITEGETATLTTDEDVVGNLLLNATDADTDAASITWSIASAASNGTANVTGTGLSQTVSYSPNADFNGSDSFTVSISDGSLTDTITVNVIVNAVNDAPVINSAANTRATEGEVYIYTATATDAENDTLIWSLTTAPSGMNIDSATGVITWTPGNGVISENVVVEATDSVATTTQSFTITIGVVNDAPVITEGAIAALSTDEDTAGSVTLNATDADSATLTWSVTSAASNGSATATGTGLSKTVSYTPNTNFNGTDSFVVQVSDGALTDTITVNVTVNAVDDAPAIAQSSTIDLITDENTAGSVALTAVDIDTDAANLIWTVITDATDGVASISGSGTNVSADYTPTANFSGSDSFVVQLSDGTANVSITVNVTVNAVNEAPVITNGATATMTTNEDTQATLSLAATDADGDTLTWSIPVGSGASQGGVAVDGTGLVTYVPSLDTNGTDTFSVQVSDGELTDTIAVTVTITAVNDAPVITEGSTSVLNTNEDDDTGSLTFSATDADGDALTWSINTGAQHGIVTLNGSQFSYAPNIDFNGSDSFIVQVTDGVASATNTVTVNVAAVNDAPMVISTAVTAATQNQVYAYNVTASDVEGDAISYSLTTSPSGMAIDSTTGEIRWIPSATGTETVVVSVTDGSDADTQTFDISVQAEPAVAGRAVKGVLSNATVEAATYGGLDVNGDHVWNLIGTTTTDAQGYFGFDLGPQSAPVRVRVTTDANSAMVCDTPSGCVLSTFALYGETGAPEVGLTLDTIVSGADFGGPIAVTPLTNMAAVWLQQFPQAIDDNNILLTHRRLSELFGFGDENYMLQRAIDITSPFELAQAVASDMNRVRHAVFAASLQETATVKGLSVNSISDGLGLMFGVLGGQMPLKSGTIDVTALNLTDGTTSLDYTGFDTFIISAKTVANYVNVGSALDSMIAGFDALVTRWSPEATDPSICLDTDPLVDRTECRNVTTLGEATGYDVANFTRAVAPLDVYDTYYAQVAAAEAGINQTNRSLDWLYVTTEDQTNTANLLAAFSELLGYGVSTSVCVPLLNNSASCSSSPVPSADFTGLNISIPMKSFFGIKSCTLSSSDSCALNVTGTAQGQTFNVTAVIPDIRNLLGGSGGFTPQGGLDMCYNGTITNSTAQLVLTNVCFNLDVSGSPSTALAPFANKMVLGDGGYADTVQVQEELNALLEVINLRVALRSLGGSLKIVSADNSLVFQTNELDAGFVFDRLVLKGTKTGPVFDVYVSSLSRTNPAGETLNSISGQDLFRLEINDTSYMTTAKVEDKIGLPAVTSSSNVTIEGLSPIIDVMKNYALSLIDTNVTFVAPTAQRWQEIQDEVAANLVYGGTQIYDISEGGGVYTMTLEQAGYIDISQKNSTANAMRIFLSGAAGYIYADETLVATAHLGNSQDGLMISLMDGSQRTYTSANPDPLGGLQGFLDFLTILVPPTPAPVP